MIDINKIAAAQGLNREDVIEFLQDFLEYTKAEDLPGLRASATEQNLEELRQRAHSIRGAALNLKLEMIAAPAEKIEKQFGNLPIDEIEALMDEIEQGLGSLAEFLRHSRYL